MKIGLKAKEKYITKAAAKRREWQHEVDQLRNKRGGLQKNVDDLKGTLKNLIFKRLPLLPLSTSFVCMRFQSYCASQFIRF